MGPYPSKTITAHGDAGDLDNMEDMFRRIEAYSNGVVRDPQKRELSIDFQTPFREDLHKRAVSLSEHYQNLVITLTITCSATCEVESWRFLYGEEFAYYYKWEDDILMYHANKIIEDETNDAHASQTT